LARRFSRMRCSKVMMKMVVWRPQLSMYILLRLRSWTVLLPHLRRCAEIVRKLRLRGGGFEARTSPASTSGSSNFNDHQEHQRMHYTVEVS
jgi:hypothetical protein